MMKSFVFRSKRGILNFFDDLITTLQRKEFNENETLSDLSDLIKPGLILLFMSSPTPLVSHCSHVLFFPFFARMSKSE